MLHRYTVYCTEPSTKCEFYIHQSCMGGIILWAVTWSKQEKPGSVKHRYVTYGGALSLLCNCPQCLCSFFPSFSSPLSSFLLPLLSLPTYLPPTLTFVSIHSVPYFLCVQLFLTHHHTLGTNIHDRVEDKQMLWTTLHVYIQNWEDDHIGHRIGRHD